MRVGRIPYINCFPVYGAIDRGLVALDGELVTGVPSALNRQMAAGTLDVSVVSAVEYARDSRRYVLLPDLAISCHGPVRSVLLFSRRPASALGGRRVIVSRSSMTSVLLTELLFESVWKARPEFVPGDAEVSDIEGFPQEEHEARLVIGDAALLLRTRGREAPDGVGYPYVYDLGLEWQAWTGLPFVFAVWVALRATPVAQSLGAHASLIASRDWGLAHLDELSRQAAAQTGVPAGACRDYFRGLDYGLGIEYLGGLTEFFGRLAASGRVPATQLQFLAA
ncbi:MAG: menaquinone biosynthesis protein [Gemmatimonadaceae bacterium]|nr:menaquinone biosynthesis protein [Gemmatimonadaceae bacterium]